MAFTNYTGFVSALCDLVVTGVKRVYDEPPQIINVGDLPIMWPRIPSGNSNIVTLSGGQGLSEATCQLVIAVNPAVMDSNSVNFATALSLMDALETVFATNAIAIGIDRWSIGVERVEIASSEYWAVVSTVEAS